MRVLLLLLFASVTFGQPIADKVKTFEDAKSYSVAYDKFKKETRVETVIHVPSAKKGLLRGRMNLRAWFYLRDDGDHLRVFAVSADVHSYFNKPFLRFLADGELVEIQSKDIDSIATFNVSAEQWAKLAAANKLEVRLNESEGVFDEKALTKLRNLDSLTKSQPPAPAK